MKKAFLFVTVIALVTGFAVISNASVDSIYEAAVINMKGDVKVDPNADGSWFTPWIGMKLKKGALLKAGPDSWAEIVFDVDGLNILRIKENTQITIDRSSVKMPEGSVLAKFDNLTPGSSFVVRTPNAACGIRGSGMGVTVVKGKTIVEAFEDKAYLTTYDANGNVVTTEFIVPEEWKTTVRSDGKPEQPVALTPEEKDVWEVWVDALEKGVGEAPEGYEPEPDSKDLEDIKTEEKKKDVSPCS